MTTRITPREWEALSAYLDHQLNKKELSQLETRLDNSSELKQALEELQRTRIIIHNAPKRRAPRNFTLTQTMAGSSRSRGSHLGAYPVLRLASMLATLFFIVVTLGSFTVQFLRPAPVVVMSSDTESNRVAPPFGMGGGGGGAQEPPVIPPAPTEEALIYPMEEEAEMPMANVLEVTPVVGTEATPTAEQFQALTIPQEPSAADASPEAEEGNESVVTPESARQAGEKTAWSFLGILQIALALLALITGLAAIYLRRGSFR